MKKEPGRLDWEGARARLKGIQDSIDRMQTPTAEELLRVHKARAAHLARTEERLDRLQTEDELIVFRLGEERYAFEVAEVTEVLPAPKVAPAPGAPPSIAGVIQVRGEIRPVYDLHRQLGIVAESAEPGPVILMRTGKEQFGVRVDSVQEIRPVMKSDPRLPGQAAHVAWMTEDLVSVLSTQSLWKRES